MWLSLGLPILGTVCMILYSFTAGPITFVLQTAAIFILIGGASFMSGGLLGFLFGIPKSAQVEVDSGTYKANTNLEQISDWLSKILLGVGLTQIGEIAEWIGEISRYTAKDMTAIGNEAPFIASIIVYFIASGFLNGYLATRIFLPKVFEKADNVGQSDN